jgi:adenosylhomocysteine nucleosidase
MKREVRPWLIAAAVEQEIEGIRAALKGREGLRPLGRNAWEGEWRANPLVLVRTGVGPRRAREGLAPFLRENACRGIVSTGYAGGLVDKCALGDLLVPEEILSVPPLREARFRPDRELRRVVLERAGAGPWQVHADRMITCDRVIFSSPEKRRLGLQYDAGSVEMESAAVAELACEASVPFAVVRVVLDEAAFSLPDILQVVRWYSRRQFGRLIPYLALRPKAVLEFLRLRRRSRRASEILSRFFVESLLDGLTGMAEA